MNNIQIFKNDQFGEVRVLERNGEPWFVGKDVAEILGYSETNAMTKRLDSEDFISDKLAGMNMKSTLINESGLYAAILGSRLPQAKQFKRWVTSEVLPSIRKTGGYIDGQEIMSDAELMAKALLVANRQIEERNREIERMKPKEIFADAVAASKTSILVGDLAKLIKQNGIDTGQKRLFQWLRDNGYLIRRKGADWNMPTQRAMEMDLFEVKETVITHADGHTSISKTVKVTGKGQQYFINKFMGAA